MLHEDFLQGKDQDYKVTPVPLGKMILTVLSSKSLSCFHMKTLLKHLVYIFVALILSEHSTYTLKILSSIF